MGILDDIKRIIKKDFDFVDVDITAESLLVEDLGFDSLDVVEFVMAIEEEFDIEIYDEDAEKIKTVGDAVAFITKEKGD